MENGQVMLDNEIEFKDDHISEPKKAKKKKRSDSENSELSEFDTMFNDNEPASVAKGEEEHVMDDYYVLLCIKDPKRMELI